VSTHPDNPFWNQATDKAVVIYRHDWDQAVSDGHVTPDHVAQRLLGIMQHAYGVHDDDFVAYDADGFIVALIAEGLRMSNGLRLDIFPGDHNPPHAHIKIPGQSGKLTIDLETFEIQEQLPDGWSGRGRKIEKEARAKAEELAALWNKNRGPGTRGLPST
jgi:hypothetical protein